MARALDSEGWDEDIISTADTLDELKDGFKLYKPLIYLDSVTQTVNLVYQSAKGYVLGEDLERNSHLSIYRFIPDKASCRMFTICWRYLSMKEFSRDTRIIKPEARGILRPPHLEARCFLQYAIRE